MLINRKGFGQVEPNHLSAQRTGQIYAQLPADSSINMLENGQFAKYDYANNKVDFNGEGEFMLVLNEVKVYDERDSYKDFAMIKTDYLNGEMYPRLFKTNIGDIFTTNCVEAANTSKDATYTATTDLDVGNYLTPNANTGYLEKTTTPEKADMVWKVVKIYTMPDGKQPGIKIQRIK